MDTGGGRVGARMIAWRREHAKVCPEWPKWAVRKGLTLDPNGALLYPGEDGPFEPRQGSRASGTHDEADEPESEPKPEGPDLLALPDDAFSQASWLDGLG